ncbi:MAG: carbohydrate ABC transporter permease, partial [Rhodococcus sp. (in: high G+C Gram-positive bacteria)]
MTTSTPTVEVAAEPVIYRTLEPRWRRVRGHVVLAAIAAVCAFPVYWLFATSLRQPGDVLSLAPVPWPLSIDNYVDASEKVDVVRLLANTFGVALVSALGQLLVALLASYAFAMYT